MSTLYYIANVKTKVVFALGKSGNLILSRAPDPPTHEGLRAAVRKLWPEATSTDFADRVWAFIQDERVRGSFVLCVDSRGLPWDDEHGWTCIGSRYDDEHAKVPFDLFEQITSWYA